MAFEITLKKEIGNNINQYINITKKITVNSLEISNGLNSIQKL